MQQEVEYMQSKSVKTASALVSNQPLSLSSKCHTAPERIHTSTLWLDSAHIVSVGHWKAKLSNKCSYDLNMVANDSKVEGIQTTLQYIIREEVTSHSNASDIS